MEVASVEDTHYSEESIRKAQRFLHRVLPRKVPSSLKRSALLFGAVDRGIQANRSPNMDPSALSIRTCLFRQREYDFCW